MRRQADTPWFRSFLLFDPAKVMTKVRKPILILQAGLDREVSSGQFEKLTGSSQQPKAAAGTNGRGKDH